MSFSSDVKKELGKQYSKSRHCQIAELAGMILLEGEFSLDPLSLSFSGENKILKEKYALLMKQAFGIEDAEMISPGDTMRVLGALKFLQDADCTTKETDMKLRRCNGLLLQKNCCRRAFIRGAFMACGSISDPGKYYHFEIVCKTREQAVQLKELMNGFETEAKIVERKGHFVVYLKEGAQIVDMLNVMEAYVALMNFENVRILKEMRNSVNRKVNCETANISKTVNAAVKQIEDITFIRDNMGFDPLPANLKEMALLRLEYPNAALKDLGNLLDPPVGKSGVNHRLRRLNQIAEKLREESNYE